MKRGRKLLSAIVAGLFLFITFFGAIPARAAVSTDATLKSVSLSKGTLTPKFNKSVYEYDAYVNNDIASITVTPSLSNRYAKFEITGATLINRKYVANLNVGANVITINVTAQDNVTKLTYTITVHRAGQNDANLLDLALVPGVEGYAFDAAKDPQTYAVNVANEVTSIKLAATAADTRSLITVNYAGLKAPKKLTSGKASSSIPLVVGDNVITVTVVNDELTTDGPDSIPASTKVYTITVNRHANINSNLKTLSITPGKLDKKFSKSVYDYELALTDATTSVAITLSTEVSTSNVTVTVDGQAATIVKNNQKYTVATPDAKTYAVAITVTAEDTNVKTTYNVTVVKPNKTDDTLTSLTISEGSLTPAFDKAVLTYRASVENSVDKLVVESFTTNPSAKVKTVVNGIDAGTNKATAKLNEGLNTILINVFSNDGNKVADKTYTITIARMPKMDVTVSAVNYTDKDGAKVLLASKVKNDTDDNYCLIDLTKLQPTDMIKSITINVADDYTKNLSVLSDKQVALVKGPNTLNDLSVLGLEDTGVQGISVDTLANNADAAGYVTVIGTLNGVYNDGAKDYQLSEDFILKVKVKVRKTSKGIADVVNSITFNLSDSTTVNATIDNNRNKFKFDFSEKDQSLYVTSVVINVKENCVLKISNKTINLTAGENTLTLADIGIEDNGEDGASLSALQSYDGFDRSATIETDEKEYVVTLTMEW